MRRRTEEAIVYAQLTTVEFDTAGQRNEALKLMSAAVQLVRAMRGFEAAYYLDVDELHIVAVLMFDSEEDLHQATGAEYEALQKLAREKGAKTTHTDEHRVMAFATNTE
jgi:heme-degrading monooxygenase HmoA